MASENGEEEGETKSVQARWWLTNDVIAGILTIALVVLNFLAVVLPAVEIPSIFHEALVLGFLIAVVWAFGSKAAKAILDRS